MHGKGGTQESHTKPLASALRSAGVVVVDPLMPWGKGRIYAKSYEDSMLEIDGYVEKLKAKGARRIVVAGHSMGANAALGYGARRQGLSGIIALATGHTPELGGFQNKVGKSVSKAKTMIDAGNGDKKGRFKDLNVGKQWDAKVEANIYYSWFAPDGPAAVYHNTKNLKEGTPLLWVDGSKDNVTKVMGEGYAFEEATSHPMNQYTIVDANHFTVPKKSTKVVIDWLKRLK